MTIMQPTFCTRMLIVQLYFRFNAELEILIANQVKQCHISQT